jgi:hypothetical protein
LSGAPRRALHCIPSGSNATPLPTRKALNGSMKRGWRMTLRGDHHFP